MGLEIEQQRIAFLEQRDGVGLESSDMGVGGFTYWLSRFDNL